MVFKLEKNFEKKNKTWSIAGFQLVGFWCPLMSRSPQGRSTKQICRPRCAGGLGGRPFWVANNWHRAHGEFARSRSYTCRSFKIKSISSLISRLQHESVPCPSNVWNDLLSHSMSLQNQHWAICCVFVLLRIPLGLQSMSLWQVPCPLMLPKNAKKTYIPRNKDPCVQLCIYQR